MSRAAQKALEGRMPPAARVFETSNRSHLSSYITSLYRSLSLCSYVLESIGSIQTPLISLSRLHEDQAVQLKTFASIVQLINTALVNLFILA